MLSQLDYAYFIDLRWLAATFNSYGSLSPFDTTMQAGLSCNSELALTQTLSFETTAFSLRSPLYTATTESAKEPRLVEQGNSQTEATFR